MKKILLISGGMDSLLIYFSKKEIFDKCIAMIDAKLMEV